MVSKYQRGFRKSINLTPKRISHNFALAVSSHFITHRKENAERKERFYLTTAAKNLLGVSGVKLHPLL